MALAHHLMTVVYNLLARGGQYVELGADYYDRHNKEKVVGRLVQRLIRLGYYVDLKEGAPTLPPPADMAAPEQASDSSQPLWPPDSPIPAASPIPVPARKRGRPCKCLERGIKCTHAGSPNINLLIPHASAPPKFS
jgi:hypothetical protein